MDRNSRGERGSRDEGRSRDRGEERPSRDAGREGGGRERSAPAERGGGRGQERSSGRGGYEYQRRSQESVKNRANQTARNFDSYFKDGLKVFKTNEGDNIIRILPPTWKPADHYGHDIWVHGYIGADNQSYLCPKKHDKGECPICEELGRAKKNEEDEKYIKSLEPKKRVVIYLVDRDDEKEGVQIWAMPWTVDRDICKVSQVDRRSGETLFIDDPENGYDVEFERKGTKDRTEYIGMAIARRESPLGNNKWLDYAEDNPIPEQLVFYDYDVLAKVLGGGGGAASNDRGSRDRGADDTGSRRESSSSRGRASLDEEQEAGLRKMERGRGDEPTWDSVHKMKFDEMCDLIDKEGLKIDPDKSKDDTDLADWICEDMKLAAEPAPSSSGRRQVTEERGEESPRDKLRNMRTQRD